MSDKLLIHSNAPHAPTGYGSQTALFAKHLKEIYELGISCFYGVEGNVLPWNGLPMYPGIGVTHGNETIREHTKVHFGSLRGGLVLSLMDVWVLDPAVWRQLNHVAWTPIDHEPCPPPIQAFLEGSTSVPMAMSRFGEEQLREAGFDPLYCPHAVDTSVYRPYPIEEAREASHIPKEAFVVGMVAANKGNPSRKCFSEAFQAFKVLRERCSDAVLYIHAEATGRINDGVNLPDLMGSIGVDPETVLFPDQYRVMHYPYPPERMAQIFSSFDVLLAPSAGEGFGIPAIEAQACGVPVIASDFSAQPETVGAGWLVSGRKHYTPLKAWQFQPDVEDIAESLISCYGAAVAAREGWSKKARAHAEGYDIEVVLDQYMLPALQEAAERFGDREPVAVAA